MVIFDENMMSTLMGGFRNLKWVSYEVPAIYTSSFMCQDGVMHYVDKTHEYGVPGDVCPMPAAELGAALEDEFPKIGHNTLIERLLRVLCDKFAIINLVAGFRVEMKPHKDITLRWNDIVLHIVSVLINRVGTAVHFFPHSRVYAVMLFDEIRHCGY